MRGALRTLGAAVSVLALSCGRTNRVPQARLTIAISTDMEIPKDLDRLEVEVELGGQAILSERHRLGSKHVLLPTTIVPPVGDSGAGEVRVRVVGYRDESARVVRDAIVTLSPSRQVLLRMPLNWLCDGRVEQHGKEAIGSCPDSKTCHLGSCVDARVDANALDYYADQKVYGLGLSPEHGGGGHCFDTVSCFEGSGTYTPLVQPNCVVQKPSSAEFNLALVPADGRSGICGEGRCYVPLDQSERFGWKSETLILGSTVAQLPASVCAGLRDGTIAALVASLGCVSKTERIPTCGSWSSVSDEASGVPASSTPSQLSLEGQLGQTCTECLHSACVRATNQCLLDAQCLAEFGAFQNCARASMNAPGTAELCRSSAVRLATSVTLTDCAIDNCSNACLGASPDSNLGVAGSAGADGQNAASGQGGDTLQGDGGATSHWSGGTGGMAGTGGAVLPATGASGGYGGTGGWSVTGGWGGTEGWSPTGGSSGTGGATGGLGGTGGSEPTGGNSTGGSPPTGGSSATSGMGGTAPEGGAAGIGGTDEGGAAGAMEATSGQGGGGMSVAGGASGSEGAGDAGAGGGGGAAGVGGAGGAGASSGTNYAGSSGSTG